MSCILKEDLYIIPTNFFSSQSPITTSLYHSWLIWGLNAVEANIFPPMQKYKREVGINKDEKIIRAESLI